MGTTLTGTTPQDTYDSLIKVTDNGPLSGTAKYLSDGLGNDSALALSTSQVGIGTSSPQGILHAEATTATQNLIASSGNATFRIANSATSSSRKEFTAILDTTNNRVDIQAIHQGVATLPITLNANGGKVGIGTSSPTANLTVGPNPESQLAGIELFQLGRTGDAFMTITDGTGRSIFGTTSGLPFVGAYSSTDFVLRTGNTERLRILAGGGLTFNGDTAAANALDDYEEGTWTMGISFGGASVGVTTSANTGTYTKIGRQVTVNGLLTLTSKGSSTGSVNITGLPFAIANTSSNYSSATMRLSGVTFANQFQAYGAIGLTTIAIDEITEAGVVTELTNSDFANDTTVVVSLTYFV